MLSRSRLAPRAIMLATRKTRQDTRQYCYSDRTGSPSPTIFCQRQPFDLARLEIRTVLPRSLFESSKTCGVGRNQRPDGVCKAARGSAGRDKSRICIRPGARFPRRPERDLLNLSRASCVFRIHGAAGRAVIVGRFFEIKDRAARDCRAQWRGGRASCEPHARARTAGPAKDNRKRNVPMTRPTRGRPGERVDEAKST